jgi:ATP-dependent RNA helicase DDX42
VEEKRETALASTTTTTAPSYRAQQARQDLNSTFLPAGSRPQRQQPHDDDERNPHDWQQVGVPQIRPTTTATFAAVRQKFWEPTNTTLGSDWRRTHDVHCSADIDPITSFAPLQAIWTPGLLECLDKQGYTEPTLVQSQTLPVALAGRDVLVTAATGQGKTLAYLWPLVVHVLDQPHLAADETGPIALVLVPTRELAQQVHKQAKLLLAADGGTSKAIIGGQGKYLLFQELKKSGGMEIAVATPGRLLDVLSDRRKRNGTTLDRTTIVVLDEADKMLQMGFETQVRTILKALRPDRQTLLLSATLGRRIESIAREWLQPDYVRIAVGKSGETSEHVDQHVMVLPNVQAKQSFLLQMIPTFQAVGRAIVFVATRDGCESLAKIVHENTQGQSISLATLHGDKHQSHRTSTLRAFTKGDVSILIATDVAGRGLDVPQVATVVNYDPPKNLDTHVHRVGRAGRLSKQGTQQKGSAYTLLTPKDAEFGHVLRNSFAREGREISDDLQELAETSRKSGNIVSRKAGNRGGLGFESVPTAPLAKRSRWH